MRVAAAYARSEVIANHFKFFSANPTFAEFAEEVVGLTDSVGSEGTDTKELYDMLRSSSIKGPAGA